MKILSRNCLFYKNSFSKSTYQKNFISFIQKNIKEKKPIIASNIKKKNTKFQILKDFKNLNLCSKILKGQKIKNFFQNFGYLSNYEKVQILLFFEFKNRKNYLWINRFPDDPLFCLSIQNIKYSNSFFFLGNRFKWAKPIILFDNSFEKKPHLNMIKKIFERFFFFKTKRSKILSHVDHVISFCNYENKIWLRIFQINFSRSENIHDSYKIEHLIEIGPRMTLEPIRGWSNFKKNNLIYDSTVFKKKR